MTNREALEASESRIFSTVSRFVRHFRDSAKKRTFRWFAGTVAFIYGGIFVQQILTHADFRLTVYLLESALVFFLPVALAKYAGLTKLTSKSDWIDAAVFMTGTGGVLGATLMAPVLGLSPRLGFVDASVLLLLALVLFYGRVQLRAFALPLSPFITTLAVILVISNENEAFIAFVGKYFIGFTTWSSAGVLGALGYSLTLGDGFFTVNGARYLVVVIGLRCGGLDVALIYSMILATFLWQPRVAVSSKAALLVAGVVGAIIVNTLRVAILTMVYVAYGTDTGDMVHQNLGDLMFLGYIAAFWLGAKTILRPSF